MRRNFDFMKSMSNQQTCSKQCVVKSFEIRSNHRAFFFFSPNVSFGEFFRIVLVTRHWLFGIFSVVLIFLWHWFFFLILCSFKHCVLVFVQFFSTLTCCLAVQHCLFVFWGKFYVIFIGCRVKVVGFQHFLILSLQLFCLFVCFQVLGV